MTGEARKELRPWQFMMGSSRVGVDKPGLGSDAEHSTGDCPTPHSTLVPTNEVAGPSDGDVCLPSSSPSGGGR